MKDSLFLKQTHSTNALMWQMIKTDHLPEGFLVYTDYQTAGKGQSGNSWESEAGKNLLFSLVLYPQKVPMDQMFFISQLVSLGIKNALDNYVDGVEIKWPNDIYLNGKKLAGILIENSFQANKVKTVVGVGLNVNQNVFVSNAPNPVSLKQFVGKSLNRKLLLNSIRSNIMEMYNASNFNAVRSEYTEVLYRKNGFHGYKTENEEFRARIVSIHSDGMLELETESGEQKGFYFKEVQFV